MSKRRAIAVGVGVALAVALALWWSAAAPSEAVRARPLAPDGAVERPPAQLGVPSDTSDTSDRRVAVGAAASVTRTAVSTRAATGESLLLTGAVVARDPAGGVHLRESGSFVLVTWYGSHRAKIDDVEVVGGRYVTRVPRNMRLSVVSAELGGRGALPDRALEPVPVPADGVFDVELRWFPRTLLHVRSSADGRELDGCTILYDGAGWFSLAGRDHPGSFHEDLDVLREGVASPVELDIAPGPSDERTRTLLVRAAGHAWEGIEIDVHAGGERTIELDPAGALVVVARGAARSKADSVVLRRGADFGVEMPLDEGTASFDGLVAGRYDVSVERGWREALVLARSEVEVVAGERVTLELELDEPPPASPPVALAGTLVMPPDWTAGAAGERPSLFIQRIELEPGDGPGFVWLRTDDVVPIEGRPRAFAWRVDDVQPGRFWISADMAAGLVVDVGPAGREDVLVEVPPYVEVVVHVVDAETRRPVHPRSIQWVPAVPDEAVSITYRVGADAEGRYTFSAPPSTITVGSWDDPDFAAVSRAVRIGPGANEVTLEVRPACGFVLFLRDGATPVPCDSRWSLEALEAGGDGHVTATPDHPTGRRVQVSHPGLYRFDVPRIDGYERIPAQEVLVSPGAYTEHVIELVRTP